MTGRVVVVGDVLLDRDILGRTERIAPDGPSPVLDVDEVRESPGGAGLAALLCAAAGVEVTLVAPLADDDDGRKLLDHLGPRMELVRLPHEGQTRSKTRVRSSGQSLVRIDAGGPGAPVDPDLAAARAAIEGADAVLVSDYGGGVTAHPGLRALLSRARTVVWDPHPRGGEPVPGTTVVTPNAAEAARALGEEGPPDRLALALRERWDAAVCVTAGAAGAYLAADGGEPLFVPAAPVRDGDPCGAGDRFAASLTCALARGELLSGAVEGAVADASAWVADGGAEGWRARGGQRPREDPDDVRALVESVRRRGGTVVATGGCFDVLHVGHVGCLESARRAGDALVVLLNSDASVARLKGPDRPVVPQAERARVLEALSCVDAVVVFDEDDPTAALDRLRPDVWVKGGDYGGTPLPEADLVRSWGGRVLLLPYRSGRSTTAILSGRPLRDLQEVR